MSKYFLAWIKDILYCYITSWQFLMVQILPASHCYQALFNTAIVVWELIAFWCSPRIYCLERVRKTRANPNYLHVCTMVQRLDGMWTTNMLIEFYILQDVTTSSAFAFLVTSTADISQNQIPIPDTPSQISNASSRGINSTSQIPNTKYDNLNTNYSPILIYAVFSQGNFCHEFVHFLFRFLQA